VIIPSIDIQGGRAVQLRRGREFVLDGGDPLERLREFSVAGEVAVIDLDAALGTGSNAPLIREMARLAPIRVGGGIRSLEAARGWLDAGAARVILGTAATPAICSQLPRQRVIAAVDASGDEVVVDGWRTGTGDRVAARTARLAPHVGGFLFTQVEREGEMGGFDEAAVRAVVEAAGGARVTAAGGITTAEEIAALDRLGADAQVGMAIYSGHLALGEAVAAPLAKPVDGRFWPTVVVDESGRSLGLVWSTRASLARAVEERRGIYWSRSRDELWEKGATSGATQELLRIDLDCDRDALRFTVRQRGPGFCHTGTRSCWGDDAFSLADLERTITRRIASGDGASGTARLAADPALLAAKLREEAEELVAARQPGEVVHEAADLLYFTLVALASGGGTLEEVTAELARRSLKVSRRPMNAKEEVAR
jgi:phosphoribosyl-AMP cyclohydrolase / phosphoribosyl-ATP pyrophosphohydrolase